MAATIVSVELGEPRMDLTSHGDVWDASWADDGHLYVQSDDSWGFNNQPGRNLQFQARRAMSVPADRDALHVETQKSVARNVGLPTGCYDRFGILRKLYNHWLGQQIP